MLLRVLLVVPAQRGGVLAVGLHPELAPEPDRVVSLRRVLLDLLAVLPARRALVNNLLITLIFTHRPRASKSTVTFTVVTGAHRRKCRHLL